MKSRRATFFIILFILGIALGCWLLLEKIRKNDIQYHLAHGHSNQCLSLLADAQAYVYRLMSQGIVCGEISKRLKDKPSMVFELQENDYWPELRMGFKNQWGNRVVLDLDCSSSQLNLISVMDRGERVTLSKTVEP